MNDNHEDIAAYMKILNKDILPIGRYIPLTIKYRMFRSMLLRIQLKDGMDKEWFRHKYGTELSEILGELIGKLSALRCVEEVDGSVRLTKYGAYFVEDVCDMIIDFALREESELLTRTPHSEGKKSSRI